MPALYVLIGFPGSGKTTWARKTGILTVSIDNYSGTVADKWAKFRVDLNSAMAAGHDVIADACHLLHGNRKKTHPLLGYGKSRGVS